MPIGSGFDFAVDESFPFVSARLLKRFFLTVPSVKTFRATHSLKKPANCCNFLGCLRHVFQFHNISRMSLLLFEPLDVRLDQLRELLAADPTKTYFEVCFSGKGCFLASPSAIRVPNILYSSCASGYQISTGISSAPFCVQAF